jgi:hypothetical protein
VSMYHAPRETLLAYCKVFISGIGRSKRPFCHMNTELKFTSSLVRSTRMDISLKNFRIRMSVWYSLQLNGHTPFKEDESHVDLEASYSPNRRASMYKARGLNPFKNLATADNTIYF